MTDRTINFGINADTLVNIAEITGDVELFRAIGYLTQWATGYDKYAYVEIIGGVYFGSPEIIATYRAEERGPITYQLGVVWHEGKAIDAISIQHRAQHSRVFLQRRILNR